MSDPFFPRDDAEFYKKRCEELEDQLNRVKALPEKWREKNYHKTFLTFVYECANELEEALK